MDGCPKNVHLVLMGYIRIVYHITTYRSTLLSVLLDNNLLTILGAHT